MVNWNAPSEVACVVLQVIRIAPESPGQDSVWTLVCPDHAPSLCQTVSLWLTLASDLHPASHALEEATVKRTIAHLVAWSVHRLCGRRTGPADRALEIGRAHV